MTQAQATSSNYPFKWYHWILTGLLLLLIWGGSFSALYLENHDTQQRESAALMQNFNRSMSILIEPLVLADDRVSLNYLFNELTDRTLINGLNLTLPSGEVIARAGQFAGDQRQRPIMRDGESLGTLTVWLAPPNTSALGNPLLWTFAGGILAILLTLLLIRWALRHNSTATPAQRREETTPAEASFSSRLRQQLEARKPSPEPPTLTLTEDSTIEPPDNTHDISAHEFNTAEIDVDGNDPDPDALLRSIGPTPAQSRKQTEIGTTGTEAKTAPQTPETKAPDDKNSDDNRSLIDLLRPEHRPPLMPHFTPNDPQRPPSDEIEFDDNTVEKTTEPSVEELQRQQQFRERLEAGRNEEQLDLYSLEHQLELILPPMEAGYLLLIDANCAFTDNLENEERRYLLRIYRTLANSVARIYSGTIEAQENGDIELLFTDAESDDAHGVNALCAGILFTHLYRHYNQQRIRQMKPVLNLHTAIVRGAHQKLERMYEEAHFLTRTTASNELISHTALTEAPQLKQTLLSEADIRREDEDKVLILKITPAYQALLEKQARHLLSKLKAREQGTE